MNSVTFPEHLLNLCAEGKQPLLHEIFEASARANPNGIAVECEEENLKWTYSEVSRRAEDMAKLIQAVGVGPDDLVGVFLPRGGDFYVCMLAILKAGGAYVSIDPEYPAERVRCTIEDSKSKLVITKTALVPTVADMGGQVPSDESVVGSGSLKEWSQSLNDESATRVLTLEACRAHQEYDEVDTATAHSFIAPVIPASSACYAIFTSGSTGRPKGVCIEHRCAVNFVLGEQRSFPTCSLDRVLQGFSTSFDASVEEIWLAFAGSATLVVGTKETMRSGPAMGQVMASKGITVLSTVPTVLRIVEEIPAPPLMRIVITGGEACPPEVTEKWCCPGRQLLNTYGPTEATVVATYAELKKDDVVTIGKAVIGYSAHIISEAGEFLGVGVPGELLLGGPSVARGYINRPDLNPEKFIPDPHAAPVPNWVELANSAGLQLSTNPSDYYVPRLYRTGDLVQWNAAGDIEFLGRIDSQVKIRGFRVELSEIESAVARFPNVQNVVVIVREDVGKNKSKTLVAYIEPKEGSDVASFTPDAIKEHSKGILPDYMVPARYVTIAVIPLSPTGKVDRKYIEKLPAPGPETAPGSSSEQEIVPPATELEEILAAIWCELLDIPAVSVLEDFFNLGGTSLTAAQFISQLRKKLPMAPAAVRDIYDHRTVRALSNQITSDAEANGVDIGLGSGDGLEKTKVEQEPELPVKSVGAWGRFFCGLGQAVVLVVLAAIIAIWTIVGIEVTAQLIAEGWPLWYVCVTVPAFSWLTLIGYALASWMLKKLLIGKLVPGEHPLWGWFYFRFWTLNTFGTPAGFLSGTPFCTVLLRLYGTKVGRNCFIASDSVHGYDLLEIEDDVVINVGAQVSCHEVESGMLKFAEVNISSGAILGMRSAVKLGSRIDEDGELGNMAVLMTGQILSRGEKWVGAPATQCKVTLNCESPQTQADAEDMEAGNYVRKSHKKISLLRKIIFSLGYILGNYVVLGVVAAPVTYAIGAVLQYGLFNAAIFVIPFIFSYTLAFFGVSVVLKWLTCGKVKEGDYDIYSFWYLRWFCNYTLQQLTVTVCHQCYSTIYTQYYLRALGAKIGKRVEFSDAREWTPDMLEIGNDCFVADFVGLGGFSIGADRKLTLRKVVVGDKAFLGNNACVPGGSIFGKETLLAVMSLAPNPKDCVDGSSWMGSPPFSLANRSKVDGGANTYTPPLYLYLCRAVIEATRSVLPPIIASYGFLFAWAGYIQVVNTFGPYMALAIAPLFTLAYALFCAVVAICCKWTLVGKYGSRHAPLWSTFVWRAEMSTALEEDLAYASFIHYLVGTPFISTWFRLLGAKVGKRCYLATPHLTEPDMVVIGDDCCINSDVTVQGHLFEDRVMKMGGITIGDRCTLGTRSVMLYQTQMASNTTLAFMSLMMKGEEYPANARFAGIPARPAGKAKPCISKRISEGSTCVPDSVESKSQDGTDTDFLNASLLSHIIDSSEIQHPEEDVFGLEDITDEMIEIV